MAAMQKMMAGMGGMGGGADGGGMDMAAMQKMMAGMGSGAELGKCQAQITMNPIAMMTTRLMI